MTSPILSLAGLLVVLIHQADGALRLEVKPTDITPGMVKSLTVNCSFSYAGLSNTSGIISLIVSKSDMKANQQGTFVDLVSVNAFTPDTVTELSHLDADVTGLVDINGESFITIVWPYPTANESGLYKCEINGMDFAGHPTGMSQTMLVTSQQLNLDQLINAVIQLQGLAENQANEIEALLSLTKAQSQIVSSQQLQLDSQEAVITDLQRKLNFQSLFIQNLTSALYVSSEYEGHYYLLYKHRDWYDVTEAANICEDYGGIVVAINDDEEFQFLKDFLNQHDGLTFVLVNGTDAQHEGRWTYIATDTDLMFTNWEPNVPRMTESRSCIYMSKGSQWGWWDGGCELPRNVTNVQYKFVCEVEINVKRKCWDDSPLKLYDATNTTSTISLKNYVNAFCISCILF